MSFGPGRRGGLTDNGDAGFSAFMRRAFAKGMWFTDHVLARPIAGIANSWSDARASTKHAGLLVPMAPKLLGCAP